MKSHVHNPASLYFAQFICCWQVNQNKNDISLNLLSYGKTSCVHGLEDFIIIKVAILPKLICGFSSISVKIPCLLFCRN